MHDSSTWYGNLVAADSDHIAIAIGSMVGTYTGNFAYDGHGNVYGTLTGYYVTNAETLLYSATGLT
jgi:hypothetical protein